MKYFQKLAEDPYVFQLSPDDEQELDLRARGLFLSPTTLQGEQEMIREMLDEKYPEWKERGMLVFVGQPSEETQEHEREHVRRYRQGKWSMQNYARNRLARLIEEYKAHQASGQTRQRSLKNALGQELYRRMDSPTLQGWGKTLLLKNN